MTVSPLYGKLVRIALYAYVLLIACPIRYWPLESDVDATWRFALNYAAAHGPAVASTIIFTMGPLAYLTFPQNIGGNLAQGLLFQTGLWLILAAIFADVFFWAGIPLRNLALFSFCFALATPLFWFNSVGVENLMLAGALILIVLFRLSELRARYLGALVLVALLPMFKLSGALIGLGAIAGLMIDRLIERRTKALRDVTVTIVVLAATSTAICLLVMPSWQSLINYVRGSAEIIGGYSSAMSMAGSKIELIAAALALSILIAFICLNGTDRRGLARFFILFLAIPVFVSFKHGFVRQDVHVINLFCFVSLALALVSLSLCLNKPGLPGVLMILFFSIWQANVNAGSVSNLFTYLTGAQPARMLWGALHFHKLEQHLDSSVEAFPQSSRIEPELADIIGDSPVASLSNSFTNLSASRMNLRLYPVVQRYSAYTPYLDRLNASWIRDQGPRFLVFDGQSIDGRDSWAETPAMWLEVYRWYDSRLLGQRNLLLERRTGPRFRTFQTIGRFQMPFTGELRLPASNYPVFWTRKCGHNVMEQLPKLLFRPSGVYMSVYENDGSTRLARIFPELLVSPVLGNYLPGNLSRFYAVLHSNESGYSADPGYSVDRVSFRISGRWPYSSTCEVEILRPVS